METAHLVNAREWWLAKKKKYNRGLIYAGIIGLLLYDILGERVIAPKEEFEETIFDMFFQGVFCLIMMFVAKLIYSLGWRIDVKFNKDNSQRFRNRLFNFYFWVSCALPSVFIITIMIWFYFTHY